MRHELSAVTFTGPAATLDAIRLAEADLRACRTDHDCAGVRRRRRASSRCRRPSPRRRTPSADLRSPRSRPGSVRPVVPCAPRVVEVPLVVRVEKREPARLRPGAEEPLRPLERPREVGPRRRRPGGVGHRGERLVRAVAERRLDRAGQTCRGRADPTARPSTRERTHRHSEDLADGDASRRPRPCGWCDQASPKTERRSRPEREQWPRARARRRSCRRLLPSGTRSVGQRVVGPLPVSVARRPGSSTRDR